MNTRNIAFASLAASILISCGGTEKPPEPESAKPVRTCESIRDDIISLAMERGVSIVKIYDPSPVKIEAKKVSCVGRAMVSSGQETKLYYRNYVDQEGDWLVEYSEEPLEK